MAHDIFISYSSKDKAIADAVSSKLEDQNIRCWIAPRDVPAGQNFAESIIEAIDTCKVFVLIWSANTNASEHILNEINQAFDQGITIIPFRIQDVQPTRAMRYYFGRTHWLDALTPPLEKHIETLVNTIFANLGRKPEIIPAPQLATEEPARDEVKPVTPPMVKTKLVEKEKPVSKPDIFKPITKKEVKQVQEPTTAPKKGINILPIAAGAVVVVTLVVLLLSGVFKGSPPPTTTSEGTEPTNFSTLSAATATATPQPTQKVAMLNADKGIQDPQSGHWYRLTHISLTTDDDNTKWKKENEYCRALGGHLVTIDSASENDFIYNNVFLAGNSGILGATDKAEEGKWLWVTGEPMHYINWAAGEPDNCGGRSMETCLDADFLTFSQDDPGGGWRDVSGAGGEYICEFDN